MDTQDAKLALHAAVSAIARACDGAITQDGVGFNGHDTKFGKRVSLIPASEWTDEIAAEVYRMLKLYKGQLSNYGIEYDTLTDVSDLSSDSRSARDQARQAEYERKNAPYVVFDGNIICVHNSYPIKDQLKPNGFRFDPRRIGNKAWEACLTGSAAATILGIGKINLTDNQRSILESKQSSDKPAPKPVSQNDTIRYDVRVNSDDDSRLILDVPFGAIPLNIIRAIPGRRWDGTNRVNHIDSCVAVLRLADEYGLSVSPAAKTAIESHRDESEAKEAAAKAAIADSIATDTNVAVAISSHLYPFQRAGVAYALSHHQTLIADEMGLGKTRQAISALETKQSYPALIVCPPNLRTTWQREISALVPDRSVSVFSGRNDGVPVPMDSDILIIGYPVVSGYIPFMPELKALVCDESHYVKNEKADRTKAILHITGNLKDKDHKLIPGVMASDAQVIFLTGTPLLNRPKELVQQLIALGHLKNQKGSKDNQGRPNSVGWFLYRFCDPQRSGWGVTFNGATNELELNEWMRRKCMVRRLKSDVLTELPDKIRAPQFLALTTSAMNRYLKLAREGAEKAAQSRAEALVYMSALRTAIGKAKTDQAIEWAEDFLETGKSLIIFADAIDVQHSIINALTEKGHYVTRILGGQKDATTDKNKEDFQSGKSKVIVLSLRAAREGHTLTAASDVLFVELGWNPGTHNQAEDRAHRIGQKESVTAWYLVAQDTIDEWTHELIEAKRKVVNAVSDGIMADDESESVFNDVLERAIGAYGGRRV